jgi:cold-inducible RNA-binding protein
VQRIGTKNRQNPVDVEMKIKFRSNRLKNRWSMSSCKRIMKLRIHKSDCVFEVIGCFRVPVVLVIRAPSLICLLCFQESLRMGNKLYVGNLPYSVRDEDLQQAFGEFGQVSSAKVMMERDTGRSKGFGFVEMGSDAEAQQAINGMNGQSLGGRSLVVNEARPMEPRPPRTGGFGGGRREGGGGFGGGGDGQFRSPYGGGGRREGGGGGGYGGGNRGGY